MTRGINIVNRDELYVELLNGNKWILKRDDNEIDIESIAYSLSGLARYTGHCKRLNGNVYTVAEHSVKTSYLVKTLSALMHDATECIVNDLSSPVKSFIGSGYDILETRIEQQIVNQYDLDYPLSEEVKPKADSIMALIESFDLLESKGNDWWWFDRYRDEARKLYVERPELRAECWSPTVAYDKFLERYFELDSKQPRCLV